MGFKNDAFLAGYIPKMTPIDAEKKKAMRIAGIETEVVHPETADITTVIMKPSTILATPPTTLTTIASARNCDRMSHLTTGHGAIATKLYRNKALSSQRLFLTPDFVISNMPFSNDF